jgi:hypothetical protein
MTSAMTSDLAAMEDEVIEAPRLMRFPNLQPRMQARRRIDYSPYC